MDIEGSLVLYPIDKNSPLRKYAIIFQKTEDLENFYETISKRKKNISEYRIFQKLCLVIYFNTMKRKTELLKDLKSFNYEELYTYKQNKQEVFGFPKNINIIIDDKSIIENSGTNCENSRKIQWSSKKVIQLNSGKIIPYEPKTAIMQNLIGTESEKILLSNQENQNNDMIPEIEKNENLFESSTIETNVSIKNLSSIEKSRSTENKSMENLSPMRKLWLDGSSKKNSFETVLTANTSLIDENEKSKRTLTNDEMWEIILSDIYKSLDCTKMYLKYKLQRNSKMIKFIAENKDSIMTICNFERNSHSWGCEQLKKELLYQKKHE